MTRKAQKKKISPPASLEARSMRRQERFLGSEFLNKMIILPLRPLRLCGKNISCSFTGFTLIELIVAVVLLAIVAGITIHYLVSASQLYALLLAKKQADSEVMDTVSRMRREARLHVQTLTANSSEWAFSNTYEMINFRRSGTDVELNSYRLARGVERFDLKYFNATNGLLEPLPLTTTNCAQIRRVALDIKATNNMAASELQVNFFLQDDLLK